MGKPKICNPCCEGGIGSSSSSFAGSTTTSTCCRDNIGPAQWTVTLAGVAAGTCNSGFCTSYNRTWVVTHTTGCLWRGPNVTAGSTCFATNLIQCEIDLSGSPNWRMACRFTRGGATLTVYQSANEGGPIDCLVPKLCTGPTSDNGNCTGWPSSIIVSPV